MENFELSSKKEHIKWGAHGRQTAWRFLKVRGPLNGHCRFKGRCSAMFGAGDPRCV